MDREQPKRVDCVKLNAGATNVATGVIDRILFPILIGLARITLLKNRMALRQENGKPVAIGVQGEPEFVVTILSAVRLLRRLGNAELASGESYMDGAWRLEKGDLGAFLGYLLQCPTASQPVPTPTAVYQLQGSVLASAPTKQSETEPAKRSAPLQYRQRSLREIS